MGKPVSLLCSLLILPLLSLAQTGTKHRALYFKMTPTSLLDPYGSRLPAGVDFHAERRWAFGFEASIPLMTYPFTNPITPIYNREQQHYRITWDFRLRADAKYFISRNHRAYAGLECFWRNQELKVSGGGGYSAPNQLGATYDYHYKEAEVYKNMFGGGLLIGTYAKITGRIFLEPYCGLGVRHLAAHRINVTELSAGTYRRTYNSLLLNIDLEEDRVEGEYTGLYLPLGVKLNIRL